MNSTKTIYIGTAIAVVAVIGFFLWQKSSKDAVSLENPPAIPAFLIGGLTPEQQYGVDDFKRRINRRTASGKPLILNSTEKAVLSSILSTKFFSYKFSADERAKIEAALKLQQ